MSSTFDEFEVMANEYQYHIVTLSETWLRDNKHLLYTTLKYQVIILFTKIENKNVVVE